MMKSSKQRTFNQPAFRRPAVLPVILGLSLLGSAPLIVSYIFPIEAGALTGVVDEESGETTTIHLSDMPDNCFSGRKIINKETGDTEYLMTSNYDKSFVSYRFDVKRSGTYDISLETRSTEDNKKRNYVFVDGKQQLDMMYTDGTNYQWKTYSCFLEAGSHEIKVTPDWGWTFFRDMTIKCTGLKKTTADTLAECDATTDGATNTYRHADDKELLINPGKGLTVLGDANNTDGGYLSMLYVDYTRWCWADVEPKEGEYNWSFIDAYIERAALRGHKAAFGIMSFCTTGYIQNATPRWVFDEDGADGRWIHYGGDESTPALFCPNWDDPIYQEKVADFAKALAAKYDGDPRIAYIDMRAWGNWGEQHIYSLDESVGGYPWISSDTLINKYMKPYREAFKKTLLVNCCNGDKYPEAYEWAVANGMALRRDGIMVSSNGREFRRFRSGDNTPNIYEYHMTYQDTMNHHKWTNNKQFTDELEFEIRNGAASYLQMNYDMYKAMESDYRYFGNLVGYWWRMPESTITSSVNAGDAVKTTYKVRNDGVARSYDSSSKVIARVCDAEGNVVKTITDADAKPSTWLSGYLTDDKTWIPPKEYDEEFDIDTTGLDAGRYYVSIGVFSGQDDSTHPDTSFGSIGRDVDKWESIGMFEVKQPQQQPTQPDNANDGANGGQQGEQQGGQQGGQTSAGSSNDKNDGTKNEKNDKKLNGKNGGENIGNEGTSNGSTWKMPKDASKRGALVKTGLTAGGLTAGAIGTGIVMMIAQAINRRKQ